jgi:hypothetical protein
MDKHTKGPWRIGDAGKTVFGPPNGNPSPETIALCKTRANTRLIASAPELLEVCKEVILELSAADESYWKLRVVINRAEGQVNHAN